MQFILSAASLIAALLGIYLTSLHSYLLFHSLAEIFSVVIACGIFMIGWNTQGFVQNHYLLFIGIAYLYVGGVDLLHTLSYKGMGVFEGHGANLPTQLWIAGRYMEAISLLFAPFFLRRMLPPYRTLLAFGFATGLLLASIFYWKIFPDCFIEGVGLTPFKIYSEYVICLILLASIGILATRSKEFNRKVLILIIASMVTTIAQELAFTTYLSVYGPSNMIGHLLKIVSFYLVYKAIIETGLVTPCNLLFRELQKSEAKFRSIFDTNVVPIAYCYMDGRVIDANDDYLRLLGFTREELRAGEVRWDAATPPEWKHVDEAGLEHLRRDGVCPPLEKEYLRRDGTRTPVLFGSCLVPGESGQVVSFAMDLTERKRMENALRQAVGSLETQAEELRRTRDALKRSNDELEERVQERTAALAITNDALREYARKLERLNRDLEDFSFVATHDLQEPLRKIRTFGDRLQSRCAEALDKDARDYLERMISSAGRMSDLIRSIRAYFTITAQGNPFRPTELGRIARDVVRSFESVIKETGARVEVGELPAIEADAVQMKEVLYNLISNSLKYRKEGERPVVKIHSCVNGATCHVYVEDNGIGFDDALSEKIFQPFQRLHPQRAYGGTGMGLAICRKIVELHGGNIIARSTPGEGSTFIVSLPISQSTVSRLSASEHIAH
jgi:PAS domain S-box-containing protein